MRIVLACHQFLPEYGAGTEVLTYHTAKELEKRGHQVRIIAGHPVKGILPEQKEFAHHTYDGLGVDRFFCSNTHSIDPPNPMEAEYENRLFAKKFRLWLRDVKPDLVHFYHLQRLSASGVDVCRQMGIPTVYTVTDFWAFCPTNQLLQYDHSLCDGPDKEAANCVKHLAMVSQGKWVKALLSQVPLPIMSGLVRMCGSRLWLEGRYGPMVQAVARRGPHLASKLQTIDRVLVSTRFMEKRILGLGLKEERVLRIPFGVSSAGEIAPSEKGGYRHLRVGFIGTLYEHKGAHVLMEAVRKIPRNSRVTVSVYGDLYQFPRYVNRLRSLAAADGRISFLGTFPEAAMAKVFSGLDVLVVPSLWYENAPLVVSGAQAAKVPLIASDVSGLNEFVVHGLNGLLFERGNVQQLAERIQSLCDDRKMVERFSENSKPPPSMADYVNDLEGVYQDAAS